MPLGRHWGDHSESQHQPPPLAAPADPSGSTVSRVSYQRPPAWPLVTFPALQAWHDIAQHPAPTDMCSQQTERIEPPAAGALALEPYMGVIAEGQDAIVYGHPWLAPTDLAEGLPPPGRQPTHVNFPFEAYVGKRLSVNAPTIGEISLPGPANSLAANADSCQQIVETDNEIRFCPPRRTYRPQVAPS